MSASDVKEIEGYWQTVGIKNTFPSFFAGKRIFIASQLRAKSLSRRDEQGRNRSLDSEEMAVFYKNFLDTNRTRHANYNKEWYRRNFTITFLMARVTLQNTWNNLSPANGGKKNDLTAT
uniref:Uncharacterized protein n=1 Tax=Neogobius melanostomus TaxID=47308 RepID=A0A8C6SJL1_9GOBI